MALFDAYKVTIVAFRGNGRVNPQTNNTAGVIVGAVKVG